MRIRESRIRRIIREEVQLAEQGLLSNIAAGAAGAIRGAAQGASQSGLSGAVSGAVGGAGQGAVSNQKLVAAAAALRAAAARGGAPTLMSKMDEFSISMYLMDWGNEQDPRALSRALWATLKLLSLKREKFSEVIASYNRAVKATEGMKEIIDFVQALQSSTGVQRADPKFFATIADAITKNKIV